MILLLCATPLFARGRIGLTSLNNRHAVPPLGIVAIYDFLEGSGQTFADRSGNGLTGELGPTNGADATDPDWIATGGINCSTGDYARLPQVSALQFDDVPFSVGLSMELNTTTAASIISRGGSTTAAPRGGWRFAHNANGSSAWNGISSAGGIAYVRNSGASWSANTKYAYAFSGVIKTASATSSANLYRNGALTQGVEAGTATAATSATFLPLLCASSYGTDSATVLASYDGRIYGVVIYNRLLTEAEHWQLGKALR